MFPDELLPLLVEFRERSKRFLGGHTPIGQPHHLTDTLLLWWSDRDEIGIGDASNKAFQPILVTINDKNRPHSVVEYGSPEEIHGALRILRNAMVLDDLAEA
jgi:hypothetical protein